ncbi:LysR family transcriptional regulator [Erythrobacter crassostreae]|uniref:LysR family transcriptional regulator n=1 Tax=Erythrobacter crassostreae TaxID=2828328 RepID=A0A9X1F0W1_9SPHN|nr:LysR family transcriptional regulator [Erythrobacter crassostrea]MBV7257961.1 LysR family transcriptional regulator [Erythrobacter crassostrea]
MELKWLEDLAAVARLGHFARAAEARFVTQSALSRRIKALEQWACAELVDRTEHPIRLTAAGTEFMSSGSAIIKQASEAQAAAANYARISERGVTIACLHTLALNFLPRLVADLHRQVPPFEAAIVPETRTIEEYLYALRNGTCDFFICYNHAAIPFDVDVDDYPRLVISADRVLPYGDTTKFAGILDADNDTPIPLLEYGPTSIMSRVLRNMINNAAFERRLRTVYRATLAESLATAAREGLGIAWLPETIAEHVRETASFRPISDEYVADLEILIFSSRHNKRPTVQRIWDALLAKDPPNGIMS